MRKYNALYYLLFILLITGAFASMAQNSYGLKMIGGVSFAFAVVFMIELISLLLKKEKKEFTTLLEPLCLFILSCIFGMRVLYIHIPYIEIYFAVAALVLMLVYLRKMITRYRYYWGENNSIGIIILIFHLSILLFLASLASIPFFPGISQALSVAALLLQLVFIIAAILGPKFLVKGEKVSAFATVSLFRDYSVIIVSFFLLFTLYFGLNKIGLVPAIYSDEFPRAYYELVNNATGRKEKPVEGKYKHQEFIEQYKLFLKHNKVKP